MKLLPHKHGIQKRSATLSYSIITTTGLSSSLTFFKAATSAGIPVLPVCSSNQATSSSGGSMSAYSPSDVRNIGWNGRKPFRSSMIFSLKGETLTIPSAFR